jgi:hypothetical protein
MREGLLIKDVTVSHSAAIPVLFPNARDLKIAPLLFGAFKKSKHFPSGKILGIAILASPLESDRPDYHVSFKALEKHESDCVRERLLKHVIEYAGYLNAPSLINLETILEAGDHELLKKHGFSQIRSTIHCQFNLNKGFKFFATTFQKLKQKESVPMGLEVRPYEEENGREISKLCIQSFGAMTHGHLKSLGIYPQGVSDFSYSRSFWIKQKLLGAWGVSVENNQAIFDPLLVAEGKRNTWVFTYLVYSVVKDLIASGVVDGNALVHADNRKIMALMQKIGAKMGKEDALYRLDLTQGED